MSTPNEEDVLNPVEEEAKPARRRPGRPKGSRNKSEYERGHLLTKDKLEELYNRTYDFMSNEQRRYIKGVINGTKDVDPVREMELLLRQCSILFSEALIWHLDNKKVSRDLAQFADTIRAASKDLFDIRRKQRELDEAQGDDTTIRIQDRQRATKMLDELLGKFDVESPTGK